MKLGTSVKIVWIAGMPRAGSMWTFNVARALCKAAGHAPLPERIPSKDKLMISEAERALSDSDEGNVRVLKVHTLLKPEIPRSRFIVPQRDPRDALVSYMRFMKCDFEAALCAMRRSVEQIAHYNRFPDDIILRLDYSDIVSAPDRVVQRIADFLEIVVPSGTVDDIVSQFAKEKIAALIKKKEDEIRRRLSNGDAVSSDEIVHDSANRRVFDVETGFQSGHVSGYAEGGWRLILSADQQRRLTAVMGDTLKAWDNRTG